MLNFLSGVDFLKLPTQVFLPQVTQVPRRNAAIKVASDNSQEMSEKVSGNVRQDECYTVTTVHSVT